MPTHAMSALAKCSLTVLHTLHIIWTCLLALLYYPFVAAPRALDAPRAKIPKHVAVILSATKENSGEEEEAAVVKSVLCAVRCCQRVGIQSVSVYDMHGIAIGSVESIKQRLDAERSTCVAERIPFHVVEHPPASVPDGMSVSRSSAKSATCPMSRVISINVGPAALKSSKTAAILTGRKKKKKKKDNKSDEAGVSRSLSLSLTLSLASYDASKPFMASVARQLALRRTGERKEVKTEATAHSIQAAVQEYLRLPEPDLMIVHSLKGKHLRYSPLELHGFPPWIMSLTEFYQDDAPSLARAWWNRSNRHRVVPLSEVTFRRALDEYARAEMRLGK